MRFASWISVLNVRSVTWDQSVLRFRRPSAKPLLEHSIRQTNSFRLPASDLRISGRAHERLAVLACDPLRNKAVDNSNCGHRRLSSRLQSYGPWRARRSAVALAMVLMDSHVSRRDTRTHATIVVEGAHDRADGHIASTQFVIQARRVTKRRHAKRSRLRSSSVRDSVKLTKAPREWRHCTSQGERATVPLAVPGFATGNWQHGKACLDGSIESRQRMRGVPARLLNTAMQIRDGRAARTAVRITSAI